MNLFAIFSLIFLAVGGCKSIERSTEQQWKDFKLKYKKSYESPEEESQRYENFEKNLDFFYEINMNESLSYKVGVNRDADFSEEEIQKRLDVDTR
jgi:hypothetical protein